MHINIKNSLNMSIRLTALAIALVAMTANSAVPEWKTQSLLKLHSGEFSKAEAILNSVPQNDKEKYAVVIDSIRQTMNRIRHDFSVTPEQGKKQLLDKVNNLDDEIINEWIGKKYIETMTIDGQQWWFRKAANNALLINREDFALYNKLNKKKSYQNIYDYYIKTMSSPVDLDNVRNWHSAQITFTLDVNADAVPAGKKIRVWLPYPVKNGRQRNIKLISTSHKSKFSKNSVHNTVYMEAIAEAGKPTHFEMTLSYEVGAQTFSYNSILQNLQPYDVESKLYKEYTKSEYPHIIIDDAMKALAYEIVGDEQNPLKRASLVYDWIVSRYPWAGARDYSTIPNIPKYVLENGHGDCGQVALLNITLLRALGIPARWESGWMLHPGSKNLHDWCEIYFEGTGWVPCDVSFGRTVAEEVIQDYYKTGTDIYRFATNKGVNGKLSPQKKYIRCETVDFQVGEVEWEGGNLSMDKWDSDLHIDKFEPLKTGITGGEKKEINYYQKKK